MTHPALIKMLQKYDLTNSNSSYDALREILQEIVLLGLYDAGFLNMLLFMVERLCEYFTIFQGFQKIWIFHF